MKLDDNPNMKLRIVNRIFALSIFIMLTLPSVSALGSWGSIKPIEGTAEILVFDAPLVNETIGIGGLDPSIIVIFLLVLISLFYFMIAEQRRFSHSFTLAVIFIIVLIPVYSAKVYAGISPVSISGADGIVDGTDRGFRKFSDVVTINLVASVSGDDDVTSDQVQFFYRTSTGAAEIGNCSGGVSSTCNYQSPRLTYSDDASYYVKLFDDNGTRLATSEFRTVTDTAPPDLTVSVNQTTLGINGTAEISFSAKDVSKPGGSCGVGLESIIVYEGDFSESPEETITGEGLCEKSGNYMVNSTGTGSDDRMFCVSAVDRFNKTQQNLDNCVVIREDNEAPVVISTEIVSPATGDEITHLGQNNRNFRVRINISGDLDENSVNINLSSFGLYAVEPHATRITTGWMLTYDAQSAVSADVQVSIPIVGHDHAGNPITPQTLSAGTVYWDDVGPKYTAITSSDGIEDGKLIIGSNTTLEAAITDSYISAGKQWLEIERFADLAGNNVSPTATVHAAESCNKSSGSWTCRWRPGSLTEGIYRIHGRAASEDDFGNTLNESVEVEGRVDLTPPVIVNKTFSSMGSMAERYGDEVVKDDKLSVQILVNDSSGPVTTWADFSRIVTEEGNHSDFTCQTNDANISDFICTYMTINNIDVALLYSLNLHVSDRHGNLNEAESINIAVSGWDTSQAPNYWDFSESAFSCSPSLIDREVTTLTDQVQYCQIELVGSGAELLTVSLVGCTNTTSEPLTDYIRDPEFIRTDDLAHPWIKFKLKNTDMNISSLLMSCRLQIYSKIPVGDGTYVVLQNPENETFEHTIRFYNNPLGVIDTSLQSDIDEAYDAATGSLYDVISSLRSIIDIASKICGMLQAWHAIRGAYFMWSLTAEKMKEAASAYPPVAAKFKLMENKGCLTANQMSDLSKAMYEKEGGINTICSWVNCKYAPNGTTKQNPSYTESFGNFINKWQEGGSEIIDQDKSWFKGALENGQNPSDVLDVKDNFILSVAYGCIPGIIYGIEKYRQIQCLYAYCLNTSAKSGLDKTYCDNLKSYSECMFFVGELVYGAPWSRVIAMWSDKISQLFSNPFNLLGYAFEKGCGKTCVPAGATASFACRSYEIVSTLSLALAEYFTIIGDDEWQPQVDFCDLMEGDDAGSAGLW